MVNEFPETKGRGKLEIFRKIIFIFNTLQKIVIKLGQFIKLKCREAVSPTSSRFPELAPDFRS